MDVHHHDAPQKKQPLPAQPCHGETEIQPGLDVQVPDKPKPEESKISATNSTSADSRNLINVEEIIRRLMDKKKKREGRMVNLTRYEELWKAVKLENWEDVKIQLDKDPGALTSPITEFYETILHVLVKWKKALWLVKEIVEKIDVRSIKKTDYREDTALSVAASVGNAEAAELMARKNPKLLMKFNSGSETPFHVSAKFGCEKTFFCLLSVARTSSLNTDEIEGFFSSSNGTKIVKYLLAANLYGLTLYMLQTYPKLCRDNLKHRKRILKELAQKPLAFESGCKFGRWGRLIYKGISLKVNASIPSIQTKNDDCLRINIDEDRNRTNKLDRIIKSSKDNFIQNCKRKAVSKFRLIFPPPRVRIIYETKLKNEQAREIVRLMCDIAVAWTFQEATDVLKEPVLRAASLGIAEIVEEILKVYPAATIFYDDEQRTILQLAVLHRRDKVFNLFLKRCLSQKWVPAYSMKDKENVLHMAGKCVPSRNINGAALQMQLEMQWFTAVESVVHPLILEERNSENKTPREVFEDEHKNLIEDGERWMRDTASSCMVVDALIIAMVFAAIIAVPGNNEKGIPNFRNETLFKVFIGADAAALFSSSFSLLLFVRILTSRYAEEDFLKALPRRLLLGLITLILSIATMLVASSAALIMLIDAVPGPKVITRRSTVIPVTILAAFPVVFFIWSQSRLLIDVLLSTYRPPIFFVKENDD